MQERTLKILEKKYMKKRKMQFLSPEADNLNFYGLYTILQVCLLADRSLNVRFANSLVCLDRNPTERPISGKKYFTFWC